MAPTSSLTINDWSKGNIAQVKFTKPNLIGYFTTDWKLGELSDEITSLKYYDNDIDLTSNQLQFKLNSKNIIEARNHLEPIRPFKNWIHRNLRIENQAEVITFKNVLCNIMNTPFHEFGRKSWSIRAEVIDNRIYLCPNSEPKLDQDQIKLELLKRYLFVKKPQSFFRKVVSILDKLFYEVYQLKIGETELIYTADLAGVFSDQLVTNLEELASAEHVETDIYKSGQLAALEFNYNPTWWSMATLSRAKHFIIGFSNDENQLYQIKKVTMSKLEEFQKNVELWSPAVAWNFLDDFLSFVKLEIGRVEVKLRKNYVWIFNYEAGSDYVTCEPFIAQIINDELQCQPVLH